MFQKKCKAIFTAGILAGLLAFQPVFGSDLIANGATMIIRVDENGPTEKLLTTARPVLPSRDRMSIPARIPGRPEAPFHSSRMPAPGRVIPQLSQDRPTPQLLPDRMPVQSRHRKTAPSWRGFPWRDRKASKPPIPQTASRRPSFLPGSVPLTLPAP